MKGIIKFAVCLLIAAVNYSCLTGIDDYQMPNETLKGVVIDKYTGQPMLTETGGYRIKLEELSWSSTPTPEYFGNKQDGTFFNSKIFKGHYRINVENGPFIPLTDTIEMDIKGVTEHNFEVEPYLHLNITDLQVVDTTFTVKFNITSENNMYQVLDARVFVNNTSFVGSGANIADYSVQKIDLSTTMNELIYANEYSFKVSELKRGRTFYIRVGARVDDPIAKKYNLSEIKEIQIP
ncbi:MAG: DUF3823 domain-containing protein [Bacteroidota bacterium]|nr:DUF3823 domain-containing protein [Bacteroidota bacterium]